MRTPGIPDGGVHPHRAAALVHPDAALCLLRVRGLQSQEVLSSAQTIIVTQHAHDQVQRVSMQHVLVTRASETLSFGLVGSKAAWWCKTQHASTHTLVQWGHFDTVLGHAQDHLSVSGNERKLPILLWREADSTKSFLTRGNVPPIPSCDLPPELHRCSRWGPEAPGGSCSCWTLTSQLPPHTLPGTLRTLQTSCCLRWCSK